MSSHRIIVAHAGSLVRPDELIPYLRASYLFEAANPRHEHEWRVWEDVAAGTDCGFAQGPYIQRVHPSIMWAKLTALAEGAEPATKREFA